MEWFPWYPADFERDTYHLTLAQDGAYRRLIDKYMILREALPDDDAALARIIGVGFEEWVSVAPVVRKFFRAKDGKLTHKRCAAELRAQELRFGRHSERGKKAAFAKWSKINHKPARSMLADPTLTLSKNISSENGALKEGLSGKKSSVPVSAELAQKIARGYR